MSEALSITFGLQRKQFRVQALLTQELLVISFFHDFSLIQNDDAIGHPHSGETMRDDDRHSAFHELRKALEDIIFSSCIESRRGFIQN